MKSKLDGVVIFLHIPKAAGTTLLSIIEQQYPRGSVWSLYGDWNGREADEIVKHKFTGKTDVKAIASHLSFGVHQYIASPATYITMLRDPVDRVISHYYYVLSMPKHYLYEEVALNKMSLEDYVKSGIAPEIVNGQTKLLSGLSIVASIDADDRHLSLAKEHIENNFSVVGLFEQFDESLLLMKNVLGWSDVSYSKVNVTNNRKIISEVPESTLEAIRGINQLDLALYDYARERFNMELRATGVACQAELHALRQACNNKSVKENAVLSKIWQRMSRMLGMR